MTKDYRLHSNPVIRADSYKVSHAPVYPKSMRGQQAYIEARAKDETIVPYGLQQWIKSRLLTPITTDHVDEAEKFFVLHGEPFDRSVWDYVIAKYNGYLPLAIYATPEGLPVPSLTPIVVVESTDPKLPWLPSYLETPLQRGVWYPTTIATNDRKNYLVLKKFYDLYSDNPGMVHFALHDFGGRGVSSEETAEIGGSAHLVYFQGSDTMEGVRAANHYYNIEMSGFSIPATEHSVQCSYGSEHQEEYIETVLNVYAKPGKLVALVLDGYDIFRESKLLCTTFKNKIIESGVAKVVFRPDSGNPMEIIPQILEMQSEAFGFTINSKGKKVINHVGIIQGDGVDIDSMTEIMEMVTKLGYAPECVVFGSGGALLQKVNRDTYKFAQKVSAIATLPKNGWSDSVIYDWVDVFKDPITDPGKRSKSGRFHNYPNMQKVYENGKLLVDDTLENIRKRALLS